MATRSNHGDRHKRKEQVQLLLSDAVTSLCQKLLMYDSEMCIEGLLGITLDQKDIVLVNICEVIKEASCGSVPHKLHATGMQDRTFPRSCSPFREPVEVVDVTDTVVSSRRTRAKQRCSGNTRRKIPCDVPDSRSQSSHSISARVRGGMGEDDGVGSERRQGGSATDWVSDIIHNTIGPGKDTDFEADNESPVHLDASLYDDSNQSMNYTAMAVAIDTIRTSGSGEMRRSSPSADHRISSEAAASHILLPQPIMQTEKQVTHCDSKRTSQPPVLAMPGMLKSDARNITDMTSDNTHRGHSTDSMTTEGNTYTTDSVTTEGNTNITGHSTDSVTTEGHINVPGHNTNTLTSACHPNIVDHSDKVTVKMEPLDSATLTHLVGLTNLNPKIECAYTCHLCRRAFSHKRTLMRHQRTHHLGQKHFCPFCNKPFGRKDTMRRHSLMYHPMMACSQMSLHQHIPIHSSLQ